MLGAGFDLAAVALVVAVLTFGRVKHTMKEFLQVCRRDEPADDDIDVDGAASKYKYVSLSALIRQAKRREERLGHHRRSSVLTADPRRSIFYSNNSRRLHSGGGGGSGYLVRSVSDRSSIWRNRAEMVD